MILTKHIYHAVARLHMFEWENKYTWDFTLVLILNNCRYVKLTCHVFLYQFTHFEMFQGKKLGVGELSGYSSLYISP